MVLFVLGLTARVRSLPADWKRPEPVGPARAPVPGRGQATPLHGFSGTRGGYRTAASTGIGVSHPYRSSASPLLRAEDSFWRRSVTGPRRPEPTTMRSTERIGVISAAVPVKKISSAM